MAMYEPILISILATVVVFPLAVFSLFWTARLSLRELGVEKDEIRAAFDGVLHDPKALAQFLGLCVVGFCLLLGQVYS